MTVKNEASGRRSVQVEVEVPGSTQSAVERRSAEAELQMLIAKFAPTHVSLGALRGVRPGCWFFGEAAGVTGSRRCQIIFPSCCAVTPNVIPE